MLNKKLKVSGNLKKEHEVHVGETSIDKWIKIFEIYDHRSVATDKKNE